MKTPDFTPKSGGPKPSAPKLSSAPKFTPPSSSPVDPQHDVPKKAPRSNTKDLLARHSGHTGAERGEQSKSSQANRGDGSQKPRQRGVPGMEHGKNQLRKQADNTLGKGASADAEKALSGKNEDGSQASAADRERAAAKVAARAAAKAYLPGPAGKAAGVAIDKVGDKALKATSMARPTAQAAKLADKFGKNRGASMAGDSRAANRPSSASRGGKDEQSAQKTRTEGKKTKGDQKLGGGKGKFGGKGTAKKAVAVGSTLLVLLLVVVIGFASLLPSDADEGGPSEESNTAVAGYAPAGWMEILQDAARSTGTTAAPSQVPWTVLAGLAKGQTDFGRYSPYDTEDRDPDRDIAPIGPLGSAGTVGSGVTMDGTSVNPNADLEPGSVPEHLVQDVIAAGNVCPEISAPLVAAQIEVESQWNPHAVSVANAKGLTQFMDATWEGFGVDGDGDGIADPFNEHDAIASQANYDCHLVDVVKQNLANGVYTGDLIDLVLASYNAGPNAVARNGGPLTHNAENESYARKVYEALPKYEATLQSAAASRSDDEDEDEGETEETSSTADAAATIGDPTDPAASEAPNHQTTTVASCSLDPIEPPIGGESDSQGVGPFLLTSAAAAEAEEAGYDPQSPCVAEWVAEQLADSLHDVESSAEDQGLTWHSNVPWDDEDEDSRAQYDDNMEYWETILNESALFTGGSSGAASNETCVLTTTEGGDDHKKYSSQIAYSFRCVIASERDFDVVRAMSPSGDRMNIDYYQERQGAEMQVIQEALRFSYNWNRWENLDQCSADDPGPQGLIPLTAAEAEAVGGTPADRCDTGKNAELAAKLVVEGESISADERPSDLGPYQPMLGGWDRIDAAVGRERDAAEFSARGAGGTPAFSDPCTESMQNFVDDLAASPAGDLFAELAGEEIRPEDRAGVLASGRDFIAESGVEPIATRTGCGATSESQYAEAIGEYAAVVAGTLSGDQEAQDTYYGISAWAGTLRTENVQQLEPGKSSYIPRLSPTAYDMEVAPAVLADIARMEMASAGTQGASAPGTQQAIEYAVFYGGIVEPYDTAGVLLGSIAEAPTGSVVTGAGTSMAPGLTRGGQTDIDSSDCPTDDVPIPEQSMKGGSYEFGMQTLCENSVAQARSPEAAMAVKWMLNRVGVFWYSQERRNEEGFADCSSSIARAYQEGAGLNLYPEGTNAWVTWTFSGRPGPGVVSPKGLVRVPASELRPGDAYLPDDGHIVMVLSDGFIVHASMDGTPIMVQQFYQGGLDMGVVIDPDSFR